MSLHLGTQLGLFKVGICQEYRREELVLEGNPVQTFRNFLFIVLVGRQIIGTLSGDFVSQLSQTVLVGVTLLYLTGTLRPLDVHIIVGGGQLAFHIDCLDSKVYQVCVIVHAICKVDIAVAVCRQTHGDGTVRTVYCGEIIVFRLDSLFLVVKEEIHGSVIAAEQCDGGRLVLSHVFLQRGRSYAPAFCIYGYFCQVVLDGYLRVGSLTGVEEEGSGVNACFRSAFVGQGCFRLGFQVGFALLHLGYGVVVTLLCFQLLLAGTAQKAETY